MQQSVTFSPRLPALRMLTTSHESKFQIAVKVESNIHSDRIPRERVTGHYTGILACIPHFPNPVVNSVLILYIIILVIGHI